ncbi:hypothetical protein KW420_09110 [Vibrio fluvialis]|nr:hypothetical protein [Vibrio fluvialis]MBY7952235.1 hypothetical protein [Vibrio fluvialis]
MESLIRVNHVDGMKCGKCSDSFLFVVTKSLDVECAYCGDKKGIVTNEIYMRKIKNMVLNKDYDVMHCKNCKKGGNDYLITPPAKNGGNKHVQCSSCGITVSDLFEVTTNEQ